ncbi:MAG: molecular chaperone GrpE [Candidatus Azotimanducaceae bacterium]|jgi:molecular chaperone GrpE
MASSDHENDLDKNAKPDEAELVTSIVGDANVEDESVGDNPAGAVTTELAAALEEVAKYRDIALRAEAEMENVRRRAVRDVEHAHKYGLEKLIQNLLPVIDSLEKGVESAQQANADEGATKAIVEGMSLCLKMLGDVMVKEGLSAVDPSGEPFDPNLHQAMSMVENPDMEPNSVVAVMQKGYTLNDRLVRPAMVMVSKAPAGEAGSVDETV